MKLKFTSIKIKKCLINYMNYYTKIIQAFDNEEYEDTRIVVKGCGEKPVPLSAYGEMMNKFQPITKSLMFGEPCSTVPLYKKKRNAV